jgi:tRNA(fMet)-specific endonuclease VapC
MLDTNICIFTIKNRPQGLREIFNRQANFLCTSSVTMAELLYGAEKSPKVADNLSVIESFAARLEVLDFDQPAAAHSGQIRAGLESEGQPIGPYDLMIAGHARSRGLVLVTNNRREFDRVPGLMVEDWVAA